MDSYTKEQYRNMLSPGTGKRATGYMSNRRWDLAAKDSEDYPRQLAAYHGDDSIKDKLVNDPHPLVREQIAYHGNDTHHQILMHDPVHFIRNVVAKTSKNPNILKHLSNDKEEAVRINAVISLNKLSE